MKQMNQTSDESCQLRTLPKATPLTVVEGQNTQYSPPAVGWSESADLTELADDVGVRYLDLMTNKISIAWSGTVDLL